MGTPTCLFTLCKGGKVLIFMQPPPECISILRQGKTRVYLDMRHRIFLHFHAFSCNHTQNAYQQGKGKRMCVSRYIIRGIVLHGGTYSTRPADPHQMPLLLSCEAGKHWYPVGWWGSCI